jgi:P-type conjugative transfer protein TrbJ
MKRKLVFLLLLSAPIVDSVPAQAQLFGSGIVFDPSNYSQNLLIAARALQQVDNQIQALQNQASMLVNMEKNLASLDSSQLPSMVTALTNISTLINQGGGIAFNIGATNTAWANEFPGTYPQATATATLASDAQLRWQQAMAGFEQTLQVQAQVAQNVQADTSSLSSLATVSQGASGNLQVLQATNQLLALSIKQQLQIQNLMAAQFRADALDTARNAETQAAGQSEFTTFIGNGQAYTPQ